MTQHSSTTVHPFLPLLHNHQTLCRIPQRLLQRSHLEPLLLSKHLLHLPRPHLRQYPLSRLIIILAHPRREGLVRQRAERRGHVVEQDRRADEEALVRCRGVGEGEEGEVGEIADIDLRRRPVSGRHGNSQRGGRGQWKVT